MPCTKLAPVLLLVFAPRLASAASGSAEAVVDVRQLNETMPPLYSREQVVTQASPDSHHRLGRQPFLIGVGFQIVALAALVVQIVAKQCVKERDRAKEEENSDLEEYHEKALSRFNACITSLFRSTNLAKLGLTLAAYVILDNLYKPTFVGGDLMIYTVNATCSPGMSCSPPYGVIASGPEEALGDACYHFQVHNPLCIEGERDPLLYFDCKADPMAVSEVYFEGKSRKSLNVAFVSGCLLAAALNIVDLLQFCGLGWVVTRMLSAARVKQVYGKVFKEDSTQTQTARAKVRTMRLESLLRMALEGLSYGLMMLVLEVQVDSDCVELRAMLPIYLSSSWAYIIISITCIVGAMFLVTLLLELLSVASRRISLGVEKLSACLKHFSTCFVVMVIILIVVSMLAYGYSVVLAFYLAYSVPGDSAVIAGCILTGLSMGTQLLDIASPKPTKTLFDTNPAVDGEELMQELSSESGDE